MTTNNKVPYGKPDAGKPHVRFDEGEVASAKPRRGSLLYKTSAFAKMIFAAVTFAAVVAKGSTYWIATDGSDTNVGTESAPFATLTSALAVAQDGDTIKVKSGTYTIPLAENADTPWAKILSAVTVEASDPADMPEFNGGGKNVTPLWIENSGATVRGIKFNNFKSNSSWNKYIAGMIHIKAGTLDSCIMTDSTCNHCGTVTMEGNGVVTNCTFRNLTATDSNSWGAGLLVRSGSPLVVDSLFDNCSAKQGSGIYIGSAGTVRNCRIVNCKGDATNRGYGGALVMTAGLVENCIIATNTITVGPADHRPGAGGVQIRGGTMRNCLVARNIAKAGVNGNAAGGVYQAAGTVESCTIIGNKSDTAVFPGQGLYLGGGTLRNSIVFGNSNMGLNDDVNNFTFASGSVSYSCVYPATQGEGNISSDPLFDINAADGVLTAVSDCINSGTNQTWMADAKDVYGNPRLYGITDIGCYEADLSNVPFTAIFMQSGSIGLAPFAVSFNGKVTAAPGNIQSNVWDFGDGTVISGPLSISHTYTSYGSFTVKLSVYAEGTATPAVYEVAGAVEVGTGKTYVAVDGGNVWPYATPATAATNIIDAIEALSFESATFVGQVEVAPGRYYVRATENKDTPWVKLNRAVRVYSSGGPDVTFIDGGWAGGNASSPVRYAFFLNHNLCSLEGFTIEKIYSNVNFSLKESGAVHVAFGTVTNCVIRNSSFFFEGPLSMSGGLAVGCVVSNNTSRDGWTSGGVGIWGGGKLLNSIVADNKGKEGPGLYLAHANGVVSNCVFSGNVCEMTTRGSYGAVVISSGLATHCVITNNTGYNGAVAVSSSGILRNSLVAGNKCVSGTYAGGGIRVSGGTVESCTVAGNVSTLVTPGHGIQQTDGTVRNCIIANNGNGVFLDDNNCDKTGGTMEYTCVYPAVAGTGNIAVDPMFSDAQHGDYSLSLSSPCKDIGSVQTWMVNSEDLRGYDRVIGDGPELGAYEIDPSQIPFSCEISLLSLPIGLAPFQVSFTGLVFNASDTIDSYSWDFGDGDIGSGPYVSHTYESAGAFSVKLTVRSGDKTAEKILADAVSVGFPVAYVSPDGDSVWPYNTEKNAATNIQDAIDAVMLPPSGNGTVYVKPGVYSLETQTDKNFALLPQITITRTIDVVSTDGADVTVIDGGGIAYHYSRGVIMSNSRASFRGFTVRGVRSAIDDKGSSGAFEMSGGTLADCVFTNNTGTWSGLVGVKGGSVKNCLFINNSNTDSAAEGGAMRISGAADVSDCVFIGNSSVYGAAIWMNSDGAVVSNCVVAGNAGRDTGRGFGGAAIDLVRGLLTHCVITNNSGFAAGGITTWNVYSNVKNASPTVRNCLIAGNKACYYSNQQYGVGGVYHGAGTIENCTITGNAPASNARSQVIGGLWAERSADASGATYELINTILYDNTTEDSISASLEVSNCCMADPHFKNTAKNDYRLSPASANCTGKGQNRPWMSEATDLAGNRRIINGKVDIGCYEFRTSATMMLLR